MTLNMTDTTEKRWQVVYTADQLIRIGNSLRHGEAGNIAHKVGSHYTNVKIVLSGNRNQGVTTKAKTAILVVEEAIAAIQRYELELSNEISRLSKQIEAYQALRASLPTAQGPETTV